MTSLVGLIIGACRGTGIEVKERLMDRLRAAVKKVQLSLGGSPTDGLFTQNNPGETRVEFPRGLGGQRKAYPVGPRHLIDVVTIKVCASIIFDLVSTTV
jgi:hypothetical protein